jgi:predicted N-acyltransferase
MLGCHHLNLKAMNDLLCAALPAYITVHSF